MLKNKDISLYRRSSLTDKNARASGNEQKINSKIGTCEILCCANVG